jgi:hypothetical protein
MEMMRGCSAPMPQTKDVFTFQNVNDSQSVSNSQSVSDRENESDEEEDVEDEEKDDVSNNFMSQRSYT